MAKGRPSSWDEQKWTEDRDIDEEGPRPPLGTALWAGVVALALLSGVLGGALVGAVLGPRAPAGDGGGGGNGGVTFHLTAKFTGYVGVGGDIDGIVNPDLMVERGDTVTIIVTNGDPALEHDLFIETLNVHIVRLTTQGAVRQRTFVADTDGEYAYFCQVTGHRASMEGRFIVGMAHPTGPPVAKNVTAQNIARSPSAVPPAIARTNPATVHLYLEASEVVAEIEPGTTFTYWTYHDWTNASSTPAVPGPFYRVRVNDTVVVHFRNAADSMMPHSVDFHAVTGPGGGAAATQTAPGNASDFSFKAFMPGLYVYHCASPHIPTHVSAGMYGLILVEPEGGLPPVDREYYVMQGEIYTDFPKGTPGHHTMSSEAMNREDPTYVVFNGKVGALTGTGKLTAAVEETIRIYFGVGGPNLVSSWHIIGEMFDTVWNLGDVLSPPLRSVQTVLVPPGGTVIADITLDYPHTDPGYYLVDHSLTRALDKGAVGFLYVTGTPDPGIYDPDP